MAHSIQFQTKASKGLAALPRGTQKRVLKALQGLADNPRPPGCKKLKTIDAYRIRVGDYRVVYEIHDDVLVVLVIRVGHRREVYQD